MGYLVGHRKQIVTSENTNGKKNLIRQEGKGSEYK